jgi:hypothetical protein
MQSSKIQFFFPHMQLKKKNETADPKVQEGGGVHMISIAHAAAVQQTKPDTLLYPLDHISQTGHTRDDV